MLFKVRRSRPVTSADPATLAQQDLVIMGRGENPYRVGTSAHADYEAEAARVRVGLPDNWAPEWPRKNRKRRSK